MTSPGIYKIRQQEKATGIYTWFIDNEITGKTFHLVVDSSMQPKHRQSAYSNSIISFVKGWSAKDRHELYVEYSNSQGQVFWQSIINELQQHQWLRKSTDFKQLILAFEAKITHYKAVPSQQKIMTDSSLT